MSVSESDLRGYLRLPADSQEDVSLFLNAARSKAKAAGVPEFEHNAEYDLFILSLAAMYYDNRGMAFSGSYQATAEENARKLINSFVLSLRHAKEDPVKEEGPDSP